MTNTIATLLLCVLVVGCDSDLQSVGIITGSDAGECVSMLRACGAGDSGGD